MHAMQNSHTEAAVEEDWYASAFDALYPILYAHRTVEAATRESAFAIEQLQLCDSCSVLDLCCGNGRHMKHLLAHTPHVTGLDYSPALLGFARELLGANGRLVRADMRAIPFQGAFDALANFFTSFGYFSDERENQAVARGIACALKPGGRFFMDYLNPVYVAQHLEPETSRTAGGFDIVERRWIDGSSRRVNKTTVVRKNGLDISLSSESVRLYEHDELVALLGNSGLSVEAVYGDYDGSSVDDGRPRQIVVGTRG